MWGWREKPFPLLLHPLPPAMSSDDILWKPEPTRITQGHLKVISRPCQGYIKVSSFQEMLHKIVALTASGNALPGRLARVAVPSRKGARECFATFYVHLSRWGLCTPDGLPDGSKAADLETVL